MGSNCFLGKTFVHRSGETILNWIFVISYKKSMDYLKKSLKVPLVFDPSLGDRIR